MTDTTEFLAAHRGAIVENAATELERAIPAHYDSAGSREVRDRLDLLFEHVVEASASRDLSTALSYAEGLAEQRFAAGYGLAEVQAAVNVLEAAAWREILEAGDPDGYGEALGVVSTVLGAVKDALARRYVSLATHSQAPSLDLRSLFAGSSA